MVPIQSKFTLLTGLEGTGCNSWCAWVWQDAKCMAKEKKENEKEEKKMENGKEKKKM